MSVSSPVTLVWLRRDLRLADHPPLVEAAARGAVIPVYIWSPEEELPWSPGAASRGWLHGSLKALTQSLEKIGSKLILRRGPTLKALQALVQETEATHLVWSRCYEPQAITRDIAIKEAMAAQGVSARSMNSSLLFEPWTVKTGAGQPYQVFTPFWKACQTAGAMAKPLEKPSRLPAPKHWPTSVPLESFGLMPKIGWASEFRGVWTPGESGAEQNLKQFVSDGVSRYAMGRDIPSEAGTSMLSPHLHFGEISPNSVRHWVERGMIQGSTSGLQRGGDIFLKEIGWREFAYHLLYHFPKTPDEALRADYRQFPWKPVKDGLQRWQKGMTGYPIVDAGMRQLWRTGWMHNRVRMIVASFLVKDLLTDWREGARWFWDTLVDADLASNTLGWQWSAGCGADAAPFFRVFNPVLQGEKFDPTGDYVRKWVPELAPVPADQLHAPWKMASPPQGYPQPIVDHARARDLALAAFKHHRGARSA